MFDSTLMSDRKPKANFSISGRNAMKDYATRYRALCLSLLIVVTAGVARADDTAEPPKTAPGCTIFFGGTGTRTGKADFDRTWITVNRTVANAAIEKLTQLHYRIEPFFSEANGSQQALAELYPAMQSTHCAQVLELSHELSMPSKPNSVPHLNFKVQVFHLERNEADRTAKVIGEYEHDYPYDLTKDVLEHLSMSAVGATIATDVDAARVLAARGP
jgi:hypothetical protein